MHASCLHGGKSEPFRILSCFVEEGKENSPHCFMSLLSPTADRRRYIQWTGASCFSDYH